MMARRFIQQTSESRYLSTSSAVSSVEGSLKSALTSCGGVSSYSSDSLFHHLSSASGESEDSHPSQAGAGRYTDHYDAEIDCDERKMSSPNDPLVIKLAAYEARGWITKGDYVYYRKMLKNKDHRRRVQGVLAEIAEKKKETASNKVAHPSIVYKGSTESAETTFSVPNRSHHLSWEDQSRSSVEAGNKENSKRRTTSAPVVAPILKHPPRPVPENPRPRTTTMKGPVAKPRAITKNQPPMITNAVLLEPSNFWRGNAPLNEHDLRKLFVEMCFFARLGFVQPPCCLKCTYSQAVVKGDKKKSCRNWVVWRKNASTQLHPNKLDGNIVMLQCHAANLLLQGKRVEGCAWDARSRQLVYMQ